MSLSSSQRRLLLSCLVLFFFSIRWSCCIFRWWGKGQDVGDSASGGRWRWRDNNNGQRTERTAKRRQTRKKWERKGKEMVSPLENRVPRKAPYTTKNRGRTVRLRKRVLSAHGGESKCRDLWRFPLLAPQKGEISSLWPDDWPSLMALSTFTNRP